MKTVRFSQVVARSGQPETYTLWTAPKDDREFKTALKEHRVMTVHQETVGSKKDYGEVGFTEDRKGSLLIFPKSLKAFEGKRVVGVKYELFESAKDAPAAKVAKPIKSKASPKTAKKPSAKVAPAVPQLRVFRPEEEDKKPARSGKAATVSAKKPAPDPDRLAREVRRAMKQLQIGRAVAAYQTLEQALLAHPS